MRVGVHIIASPETENGVVSFSRFEEMVRMADGFGFDRITTGEHGSGNRLECVSAQTYIALLTKRSQFGPMVTNGITRDLGVAACAIASLDALSNGRAFCVLGRGNAGIRNAGLRPSTLREIREFFVALKSILSTGTAEFRDREVILNWPYSLDRVQLCLVAEGPLMLAMAGTIADGVYVGTGLLPEVIADSLQRIHEAAEGLGREPDSLEIWWETRCSVAETGEQAITEVREALSSAGNHALRGDYQAKLIPKELWAPLAEYHERYNFRRHGSVQQAPNGGLGQRSYANVDLMDELGLTEYFLGRFGVVGTPDQVVDRLTELHARGVDRVNLNAWSVEGMKLLGEEVLPRLP